MFLQSLDEIEKNDETDDSKTELSNQNKNDEQRGADALPQEEKDNGEGKSTRGTQK